MWPFNVPPRAGIEKTAANVAGCDMGANFELANANEWSSKMLLTNATNAG